MPARKKLVPGLTEAQVLAGSLEAFRMVGVDVQRQNTGGFHNPRGQYVACGEKGDSDIRGQIPAHWPGGGKLILCEVKREGFDPGKLRGEKRAHFDRQLERLRKTCENGGFGLWVNDARQVVHALTRIRDGWRIAWEGDYPFMTDEPDS